MTVWGVHLDRHPEIPEEETITSLRMLVVHQIERHDLPITRERLRFYTLNQSEYVVTEDDGPFSDDWEIGMVIPPHTIQRVEWEGTDEPLVGPGWVPRGELSWEEQPTWA